MAMRLGETPVPIPNTMVKTCAADGTMLETAWESRWLPDHLKKGDPGKRVTGTCTLKIAYRKDTQYLNTKDTRHPRASKDAKTSSEMNNRSQHLLTL